MSSNAILREANYQSLSWFPVLSFWLSSRCKSPPPFPSSEAIGPRGRGSRLRRARGYPALPEEGQSNPQIVLNASITSLAFSGSVGCTRTCLCLPYMYMYMYMPYVGGLQGEKVHYCIVRWLRVCSYTPWYPCRCDFSTVFSGPRGVLLTLDNQSLYHCTTVRLWSPTLTQFSHPAGPADYSKEGTASTGPASRLLWYTALCFGEFPSPPLTS